MKYIGFMGLLLLFVLCAVEDVKKKKITTWHLLLIIPSTIFDVITNTVIHQNISWLERLLGIGIGLLFIGLSKLTKGQIGEGDGYLISIAGVILGAWRCLEMITYSFLISAIAAIVLLTFFHFGKKRSIPFVPFLLAGSLCSMILGGNRI